MDFNKELIVSEFDSIIFYLDNISINCIIDPKAKITDKTPKIDLMVAYSPRSPNLKV